jgi:cell volume regulation protein A
VLLVVGFIQWLQQPDYGAIDMLWLFARQLGIGVIVGAAVGWTAVQAFRRARLATAGLYPVASLATAALAYGAADSLHGSGFLAVYLAGLTLGAATVPAQQTITHFHEGLGWVAQLSMFVVLGLLVFPGQLGDIAAKAGLLALVLVVVALPVAAVLATLPFLYKAAERLLLGWAGLRGAVPVVLATFPVIARVPDSLEFFNIVFFAVLLSTLAQGTTFEPLARRLRLTTTEPALPRPLAEAGTIRRLGAEVFEYPVAAADAIAGARVRDLGLPRDAVVNVIVRGQQAIPPRGSTRLRAGDELHLLVAEESARTVRELIDRWRTGPIGPQARPRRAPRALTRSSPPGAGMTATATPPTRTRSRDTQSSTSSAPPRHPRRPLGPRRRPLRHQRPTRRDRRTQRPLRLGPPTYAQRQLRRTRMATDRRRRPGIRSPRVSGQNSCR